MHPPEVKQAALELVAGGHNDCEISRRLGVPRRTILDWRRPNRVAKPRGTCPRCWRAMRPIRASAPDYAELVGLYLGDGCISEHARTFRLRIALDARYGLIVKETVDLLSRVFPANPVGLVKAHGGTMYFVSVYSSHLPCLLPQHGPGMKYQRPIVLEEWQTRILEAMPWPFIRACIRTDGCSFINRTGPYEYLSYDFSNMSESIVGLFTEACERVGVATRVTNGNSHHIWRVRINQRPSVALMRAHVGLKS
jgi:transposase-like protein